MSGEELAQKIAEILQPAVKDVAREEAGLHMKGIGSIVRREMDACLDGKCDAIASRLVEKLPKAEPPVLKSEDIVTAVKEAMGEAFKEAMEGVKPSFDIQGHTAHDILDCPTCRPIVVKKLWEDEDYRRQVMERVCEDDACRAAVSKIFEEKGYEVRKHGEEPRKEESWAKRRLRERKERKPS